MVFTDDIFDEVTIILRAAGSGQRAAGSGPTFLFNFSNLFAGFRRRGYVVSLRSFYRPVFFYPDKQKNKILRLPQGAGDVVARRAHDWACLCSPEKGFFPMKA
jgi:hypothetical protein